MARKHAEDSPKKPSFFKILVGDFSQRLLIPPKFIERFNGQLLRKCALRGPNGEWWEVELEDRKNVLFFHDGWEDFVKDHCLQVADFLVFSYDGGSKFDVTIYDRSACEKDVEAAKRKKGSPLCSRNEGTEAQVKDEDVELDTGNCEEECEKETTDQDQVEYVEDYTGHRGVKRIVSDRRYCRYLVSTIRGGNTCIEETSTGLIIFKSENSCFLQSVKKKCYLNCLMIPKELAVAEGLMTKLSVRLQDPTGRSWRVQLEIQQRSTWHSLHMRTGWCECRKANGISLGDTIVFEFVKEGVLQIHIFRKREVGGRPVRIPSKFIENFNGQLLRKCALRGPSGQWWDVELEERQNALFFHDGWEKCSPVCSGNEVNEVKVKDEDVELDTKNYQEECENEMTVSQGDEYQVEVVEDGELDSENYAGHCGMKRIVSDRRYYNPKALAIAEGLYNEAVCNASRSNREIMVCSTCNPKEIKLLCFADENKLAGCCKANGISIGDTIIFEFVKQGTLQIRIVRKREVGSKSVVIAAPNVEH